MSPAPRSVAVRMYQVGFGDCFVVSFDYARPLEDGRSERHMLVDFGSTHKPKTSRSRRSIVSEAAELMEQDTGGEIDVVVLTHRHRDHLSGFADKDGAALIRSLKPKLVTRPWTERPDLPRDAEAPIAGDPGGDDRLGFAQHLAAGHRLAARVEELTRGASPGSSQEALAQLALDQVPNREAIEFLDELAADTDEEYLSEGNESKITRYIPGIKVRVLGPPTIKQHAEITKARANDPDEFWLKQLAVVDELKPAALDTSKRRSPPPVPPGPVAWIVEKLARQQIGVLNRIVRTVDDALNNTSLILMVDAGDRRLLLPGDAQIENWTWALSASDDAARYRRLLAGVDLYKVGHHGSRNATPKSLFRLWEDQSRDDHPMTALMSTMPDVHGKSEATAVPRGSLVSALEQRMDLVRTDRLDKRGSVTVAAPCRGRAPFSVQADGG